MQKKSNQGSNQGFSHVLATGARPFQFGHTQHFRTSTAPQQNKFPNVLDGPIIGPRVSRVTQLSFALTELATPSNRSCCGVKRRELRPRSFGAQSICYREVDDCLKKTSPAARSVKFRKISFPQMARGLIPIGINSGLIISHN